MPEALPLAVFSHLRWDFVYQRPQHVLSRLAQKRPVIFIEEPDYDRERSGQWEISHPVENLLVCRPLSDIEAGGFHDRQMPLLRPMLRQLIGEQQISRTVAWFYTPMALPLLDELDAALVVYDCMDCLKAFRHAPRNLAERENGLLARADIVFTGGPSLFRAKKALHPNVHCFPSSVDAAHFGSAKRNLEEPADQRDIPHPRLGYFGVIDERVDLSILDHLAASHPDWQIVMVGPVAKIDKQDLPQKNNVHFLGKRDYSQLPAYLAGWDICLLPFARNEATEFISPTKTLEYMAAERPIVGTPITDVAEPYGHIVYLADTPEEFAASCEQALEASGEERARRVDEMRKVLAATSWDSTAERMEAAIEETQEARHGRLSGQEDRRQPALAPQTSDSTTTKGPTKHQVIVIGAGPTGLSAAYHLAERALLLERNSEVGGWCRSIHVGGFTFDYAGHIMFSKEPYVHEMYERLLGDNVHWQDREAWIYSHQVYTRYPFQGALYGLPAEIIKECIMGAIEARFGSTKPESQQAPGKPSGQACPNGQPRQSNTSANGQGSNTSSHTGNGHGGNGHSLIASDKGQKVGAINDCCADGIAESTAKLGQPASNGHRSDSSEKSGPRNFEEFIYQVWGAGIARHFAIPYNRKLWAVPLAEMETSWLGGRVPLPDLEEMIDGALRPVPKPMGPNARFGYPLRGGFQALMNGFLPHVGGQLRLDTSVVAVSPKRQTITLDDGSELGYEHLISTMPLPVLIRQLGHEAPAEIREAAAGLRHVSVRCVHLGIGRENIIEKHWIYYPEDTVFHRIFVQGNASPHCNPPGGFGLTCEITYSEYKPLPCDGEALVDRCIEDCRRVGIIREDDPIWATAQVDLPYAYVVYDHGRAAKVGRIREWLAEHNIILAGRYSEWEYYNSDHAFIAGKKAADEVLARRRATAATNRLARDGKGHPAEHLSSDPRESPRDPATRAPSTTKESPAPR